MGKIIQQNMSTYSDVTLIVVCFKSEELIKSNLKELKKFKTIIVDNSNNYDFSKVKLPKKTKIIRSKNIGYGAAINIALKKCKTKFAIISNIDVYFKKNLINNFYKIVKKVIKFSILIPIPIITYLILLCSMISVIIPAILLSLTIMSFGHFI